MIFRLFFFGVLVFWSGSALAQFSQKQAETLVETLLSTQNPLVIVGEIAHEGMVVTPSGNGYSVKVSAPRLPGREAFGQNLELVLTPQSADQIQVRVAKIQSSYEMGDGGQLSFTPTIFNGLYSLSDQGFEVLQLSVTDLAYGHQDVQFSLDAMELDLRDAGDRMMLTFTVAGYAADLQDVIDAQETLGALSLTLSIPTNQARAGDLLHLANRVFQILVDTRTQETNARGKARTLPTDLRGLSFDLSMTQWAPRWMALRDQGAREIMSDAHIPSFAMRGEVVPVGPNLANALFSISLNGATLSAPNEVLAAQIEGAGLTLIIRDIEADKIGDLFSQTAGAQTAALGALLGSFSVLEVQANAAGLTASSPIEEARLALSNAQFDLRLTSPYSGAPNTKNIAMEISVNEFDVAYPSVLAAFEPAWSTLLQPALPQTFDLKLDVNTVPGEIWRGFVGLFVDTDMLPQDTVAVAQMPTLTLDGTEYASDLVNANIGGTLMFAPNASLFARGELRLEISNLRPLIGAMQRSARVPNQTIAQFLTLGSIGLATIAGFAVPSENGNALFVFDFQQDGFPTINGRPLPIGF